MHRLLLSLAAFMCACMAGLATETTWNVDTYADQNGWTASSTTVGNTAITLADGITMTISGYSTAPKYYSDGLRIYKGSTLTFACADGIKVTKIALTGSSASYMPAPASVSSGTVTSSGATVTWTGSTAKLVYTCSSSATRLKSIAITYSGSATGGNTGGSTVSGDETTVYFIAPGYTGHDGVKLLNADGSISSTGTKASSLLEHPITAKVSGKDAVTFNVTKVTTSYTASYSTLVRWYKDNVITLTPESGATITKVEVTYSGSSYKGPFTASSGTVNSSANPLVWTGNESSTLSLTATGQVRFSYMAVTVKMGNGGSTGGNTGDTGSDKFTALYLRGDFNNWGTDNAWKFTTTDGITYTLKGVNIPAMKEFKVGDESWSKANYGGVAGLSLGNYYTLGWNNGNCVLDCNVTNATVKFFTDTKSIIITGTTTSKAKVNNTPTDGWPLGYQGVMLQGFYWDSYTDTAWPYLESQVNTLSKYFSLIWIPQSAKPAQGISMGYDPVYWFTNYYSSFGNETTLRSMIKAYKAKGTGFIADVVINHRSGASNWTDFPTETWNGVTYQMGPAQITKNDEVAWASGQPTPTGGYDTGDNFDGARDLDHTNAITQANCMAYCRFLLEDMGYVGFRYDMVKGYSGYYNKLYNEYSNPTYSVGEYFDSSFDNVKNWIESTGRRSAAFDFPFKFAVNEAFGSGDMSKLAWNANGNNLQPAGLIHNGYAQYAVTFIDNHDTYRDGSRFNGNVVAANAFMLCSPGTPCVFLPHWQQYTREIARLIAIRNAVGVSNTSRVWVRKATRDCYIAEVWGEHGSLVVKIGSSMETPDGYNDADIRAYGTDYCVWSKVAQNIQDYKPEYPTKLYLVGNVNGNGWNTSKPVAANSSSNGVYTWNNVTIDRASNTSVTGNFSILTATGSNWDVVNKSHRYGATESDALVTNSAPIKIFPGQVTASAAYSWSAAAGTYKVVADLSTMTLTITPTQGGGSTTSGTSTAYFTAPDYNVVSGVSLTNADGTGNGSTSNTILGKSFVSTDKNVTLSYNGGGSSKMAAYGALVRWYKGNVITLTPAAGRAITRVEIAYSGASYKGPFTANTGSVKATTNPVVWTGNTSSALQLTASGQMRYSYIAVTTTEADGSSTTTTTSGPVYLPVTAKSQLVAGDKYILVSPAAGVVMSGLSGSTSGYFKASSINLEADGAITEVPNDALVMTLEAGTNSTSYTLSYKSNGTTYYIAAPSASTAMSVTTSKSTSNNVTFTLASSKTTINYTKNSRRLNYGTANGGCFQAYASSNASKVLLYRLSDNANRVQVNDNLYTVSFIAPLQTEPEDGIKLYNSDGSDTASAYRHATDATLYKYPYSADVDGQKLVTFEFSSLPAGNSYYTCAYGDHVRWFKNNVITLTPADGYSIVSVDVEYTAASYKGPFTATSDGKVIGSVTTDTKNKVIEWTGICSNNPLSLTASESIRFTEMSVVVGRTEDVDPTTSVMHTYKVYLENESEWAQPYAYVWTVFDTFAEWPGEPMEYDEDADLWEYEFRWDKTPENIIFNDGVNNSNNQTEDLEFVNGKTYTNAVSSDMLDALFLVGAFNDWKFINAYRFETTNGIIYTLEVDHLDAGTEFKVASYNYNPVNLGGVNVEEIGRWYNFETGEGYNNCKLGITIDDTPITVDLDNERIWVGEGATGIEDVIADAEGRVRFFDLTGREVVKPASGIYIVVRGTSVTKEVIR